jgi:hypothetical protein
MLIFVPTPIGNLGDLSLRSLEILKEVELILCEDTRVTKRFLHLISQKLDVTFNDKEFKSVHSHNEQAFLTNENKEILLLKNVVYLSDAGMPCVSDPGALLVNFLKEFKNEVTIKKDKNLEYDQYFYERQKELEEIRNDIKSGNSQLISFADFENKTNQLEKELELKYAN